MNKLHYLFNVIALLPDSFLLGITSRALQRHIFTSVHKKAFSKMTPMFSLFINNETNETNLSTEKPNLGNLANETKMAKALKTLTLSTLIAVSVFGNCLVVASVYKNVNKRMRVVGNYLVVNLSIADMLLAIFSLSRMLTLVHVGYEWLVGGLLGLFLCKAQHFFIIQLLFVSTMNFMAIAVDRFVAVFFPFSLILKGKLFYFIVGATWIIPSTLFAFYWKMMDMEVRGGTTVCFANVLKIFPTVKHFYEFKVAESVIVTGVTLTITVSLYIAIGAKLLLRRLPGNEQEADTRRREAVARKVFRMMFIVVLVYCLCWSPQWIISIICNLVERQRPICNNPNANFVKLVVAYSNSAITPFIYPIFSGNFRTSFRQILTGGFCWKRGRVAPEDQRRNSSRKKHYKAEPDDEVQSHRPEVFLLQDQAQCKLVQKKIISSETGTM